MGFLTNTFSQEYKATYISYQSDTKNEMEGSTLANYKYGNLKLVVANSGKELLMLNSKDAVMIRFFQKIPWSKQINAYATGIHTEDTKKGEKLSYYVQANISADLKTIRFEMITKDTINNMTIDDVIILLKKTISKK